MKSHENLTPVLHCPQKKSAVRTITYRCKIIESGIWSKWDPHNLFELFSTLRSFAGAVLPTEAFKWHTTPGGTQPSHDIVPNVVGLALVLLELDKSSAGGTQPSHDIVSNVVGLALVLLELETIPYWYKIIESGIWSKSSPHNLFYVIQQSAFVHWRRAPHWSLQMTHHARRNSTKSWYRITCSWFGPCLAKIGEIRCTAATQFHSLHRRSVTSNKSRSQVGQFSRQKSRW